MKKSLLLLGMISLSISCNNISKKEYKTLLEENEKLKSEIHELKYGAKSLLVNATNRIEENNLIEAKSDLEALIESYPTSSEAVTARELLSKVTTQLKEQEKKEQKEKEQRLATITKNLQSSYDDIKEVTWYRDKTTTVYNNRNSLHLYMGKSNDNSLWLRFRIQYAGDAWLFIESYVIKTDTNTHTISTSYREVERDNGHGGIWEWYDINLDNQTYAIVKDIIESKSVKIRHNGKQYHKDRTITPAEKKALENMLDAYEALGGKLPL